MAVGVIWSYAAMSTIESAHKSNMEYARALQEKYEYYIAGLAFTLLAASIQTAKFGCDRIQTALELIGWLTLLAAGIVSLLRFNMQPALYKGLTQLDTQKYVLEKFKEAKTQGSKKINYADTSESVDIDDAILDFSAAVAKNEPTLKSLQDKQMAQHKWHLRLFVAGLILVMLSRAYLPIIFFCANTRSN